MRDRQIVDRKILAHQGHCLAYTTGHHRRADNGFPAPWWIHTRRGRRLPFENRGHTLAARGTNGN